MNRNSRQSTFWHQIRKPILTAIIAPLFLCLLIVYSPPSPFTENFSHLMKPVLGYAGLYYAFRPFTPDPRPYDETFKADVTFADGSTATWTFPNMSLLLPSELADHFRCMSTMWHLHLWDCYCYRMSKDQVLWKDAARYVARLHRNQSSLPVSVALTSVHIPIVVPGSNSTRSETERSEEKTFFEYAVSPEDLK
jgi:hypothetical protein